MVTQGTRTPADEEDEGSDIDGGSAAMNNEENEYTRGESDDEFSVDQLFSLFFCRWKYTRVLGRF